MKIICRVACWFLVCSSLVYATDSASPDKAVDTLKGKLVFLRGMEMGNKLNFDAQGALVGKDTRGFFKFSAIKVEEVIRTDKELEIKGNRVELVFESPSHTRTLSDLRFIRRPNEVEIRIAIDPSHPEIEEAAIRKVLALSAQDALATKSVAEETLALDSISTVISQPETQTPPDETTYAGAPVYKAGPGVSPPRITHSATPELTAEARQRRIQGVCVLDMIVDTKGIPRQIRILRSVDPGLDRNAILTASQYRFKPGTYEGKSVNVLINLEVNFRIY